MSLGASQAGVQVIVAVERDPNAVRTYSRNHPATRVINADIRAIPDPLLAERPNKPLILFGGPPCSGFSYSNQRTRNMENEHNWLYLEFLRIATNLRPDLVLLENVRGMVDTKGGLFFNAVLKGLNSLGYFTQFAVLNAADFGVPQNRWRLFVLGARKNCGQVLTASTQPQTSPTVRDALHDLPTLNNGADYDWLEYKSPPRSNYAKLLRGGLKGCANHTVTKNSPAVLERYKHVPRGGNWRSIPQQLFASYKKPMNCHTGLYHRLDPDQTSVVIGNFRKNMLIHPAETRGISVREAARIQSFPDCYEFVGSIGFQQQQVSNAVPPMLAKSVFERIVRSV